MKDFTFTAYKILLETILDKKYEIQRYQDYIESPKQRVFILRHDVDRKAKNSLITAEIEQNLNVKASYYFRMVPDSFDPAIIKKIKDMGHEIGYHYENLSKSGGDYQRAIKDFEKNLNILRKFYPIKTMCMHGSPMSKWDNKTLWEKFNYKNFGIIGEPYFDLNFNEVFYITDASRNWNNNKVTIRDKVKTNFNYNINSIHDLIRLIQNKELPNKIMLNMHPNNWSDNIFDWYRILLWQNFKNIIKSLIKR